MSYTSSPVHPNFSTVRMTFQTSNLLSALLLPALMLAASAVATAQMRGGGRGGDTAGVTITGSIVDAESRRALPAATVSLWTPRDSSLVTGAIAGSDGAFRLRGVRLGRYYLRVAFVGYRTGFVDAVMVRPGEAELALGEIAITADASRLDGVTVTGERDFMTVEIDRNVYRTEDMPVAAGGSATDVLRNIPSVEVDVDGNISLRGAQNVAVQINGRPVMMSGQALSNYLQTLPAGSIERVEIIANPSARYDPEGMGGILNLELKKGEDRGLSGGVNGGIGTNDSYSLGASLSYGAGPWSVAANYGMNIRSRDMLGYRLQESRTIEPASRLFAGDTGTSSSLGHSLNASVEYALTPEHAISLSSRIGMRGGEGSRATTTTYGDLAAPLARTVRTTEDEDDGLNMDYRLGYRWTLERRKHELAAELRYGNDSDTEHSLAALGDTAGARGPMRQQVDLDERNATVEGTLDYTRPLWDDAKLEAGYAGSLRTIDNDYRSMSGGANGTLESDGRSNRFDFTEILHGVYATVGQTIGPVDVQVGLRGEAVTTEFDLVSTGERFDNDYFSLFPSALVGYRPGDETQLRLSYSKRITRPRMRVLNPFSTSTDPQFRRVGNPYLKPEYTHALELSVNQFVPWGTLQLTPYARRTTDAIERFERVDSAGVVTATFENLGQVDSYGTELLSTARVGDWLSTVASIGVYRAVTDASNVGIGAESEALAWTGRLTATASLGWGTSIQASAFYRSPSDIVGGHTDAHVMSDIALTKTLFDDRARIGLRVSDPFDQAGMRGWRETDGYYIETERRWGGRNAMLTVSYLFGQPQKESARRERGGEEMEDVDW
ncbi:MAG TPA: TonB-dependent receptor [Candidatus Kapabacteria bacterium]|nr:TonB-dependent receptor [Candidatus Kapabacteria bacterium]